MGMIGNNENVNLEGGNQSLIIINVYFNIILILETYPRVRLLHLIGPRPTHYVTNQKDIKNLFLNF